MQFGKILIILSIFLISEIYGHGKLMQPVNRASAWRRGFETPVCYDDDQNYCGSVGVQHGWFHGKCGICGDSFGESRPRPNENTGIFGQGIIVERYREGQIIDVISDFTNTHRGFFRFSLCPLRHSRELETEECFIPLKFANGADRYEMGDNPPGIYKSQVILPRGITCRNCVLRWEYIAGNNWGTCEDGNEATGCGPQETFKTCSDISIQ
ncbi:uncharacterized protein LOC127284918 [Leptopilina boulardi]|uniref:uncharacterized protein LOC127284918 n=1 Tax=Leptopilina boulardi TaxID=63433 RepID=UPI0021F58D64|nr:uncharacterized protein LOC127284918 [Leptopilina boulardi]